MIDEVIFRHADREDARHLVGFHPRRNAERRHIALRRDELDLVTHTDAEVLRHARSDEHAVAGRKGHEVAALDVVRDELQLGEVVRRYAANQCARPRPGRTRSQRLPLHQRNRQTDPLHALQSLRQRLVVVERTVHRLDDHVAVDPENARDEFDAETVHHRHHDDQRRHAQHDAEEGEAGDDGYVGLLAPCPEIPPRDHALERRERARRLRQPGGRRRPGSFGLHAHRISLQGAINGLPSAG